MKHLPSGQIVLPIAFVSQLNECKTAEDILHCVAAWLPSIIHADRASVCLSDKPPELTSEGCLITPVASHLNLFALVGNRAIPQDMPVPVDNTQVGRAYREQASLICEDTSARADLVDCQMLSQGGMRTCMNAPIVKQKRCFGTINVAHATQGIYLEDDLLRLKCLAEWVANYLFSQYQLEQQRKLAMTDPLTGVANRRVYFRRGQYWFEQWRQERLPFTVAILDIDFFKKINDSYGHDAGDLALQTFCLELSRHIRGDDVLARIGGEEFALLLPKTRSVSAETLMERSRQSIAKTQMMFNGKQFFITVSIGLSQAQLEDQAFSDVMGRADTALYQAKRKGRNKLLVNNCSPPERCIEDKQLTDDHQ